MPVNAKSTWEESENRTNGRNRLARNSPWAVLSWALSLAIGLGFSPGAPAADRIQSTLDLQTVLKARKIMHLDAAEQSTPETGRLWGLLVNSGTEDHHQYNICRAYDALKAVGADERNIFVLSVNFPRPDRVMFDPQWYPYLVHARPNKENFNAVLDYLGSVVGPNDTLLIYFTGHGGKQDDGQLAWPLRSWRDECKTAKEDSGPRYLCLEGPDLSTEEFKQALARLEQSARPLLVFVGDECFAGGFAKAVTQTSSRYVAIASTDENHVTWCQTFAPAFWKCLSGGGGGTNTTARLKVAYYLALARHGWTLSSYGGRGLFYHSPGLEDFELQCPSSQIPTNTPSSRRGERKAPNPNGFLPANNSSRFPVIVRPRFFCIR